MSEVIPVRVPRDTAERIRRLVELGVFPNRSSLVREALRRLLTSEESILRESPLRNIAALVSSIIAWNEECVSDIILFGSVGRGEENVESDVDLLVLVEGAEGWVIRRRLYDLIYPIIASLGVDISLIVIEKKQFVKMVEAGEPFAKSVLIDGVQLYGGMLAEHHSGPS